MALGTSRAQRTSASREKRRQKGCSAEMLLSFGLARPFAACFKELLCIYIFLVRNESWGPCVCL